MTEAARRRILLTGVNGQVGWELRRTLQSLGEVICTDVAPSAPHDARYRMLELSDADAIRALVRELRPQLIVNPAAYTAVDQAEDDAGLAMAINGVAPGVFAEEAKRCGAALVHYSTDYIFDGTKPSPYVEEDAPNPLNVYGRSKLAGERAVQQVGGAHLIFRTSWVYSTHGRNFLLTILRLARERSELNIVDDQVGAPNWSRMLAEATAQVLAMLIGAAGESDWPSASARFEARSGVYHLTAGGAASWCGFARRIVALAAAGGLVPPDRRINGIATDQYPTPARRPLNSRLLADKLERTFGVCLPAWDEALRLCMEGLA